MKPSPDVKRIVENHALYYAGAGKLPDRESFLALLEYVKEALTPAHLNSAEVDYRLAQAREEGPGRGDLFMHYASLNESREPKHAYMVLHIGLWAQGCEPVVIYQDMQTPTRVWVRWLWEWLEEVAGDSGESTFRYHPIGSLAPLMEVYPRHEASGRA